MNQLSTYQLEFLKNMAWLNHLKTTLKKHYPHSEKPNHRLKQIVHETSKFSFSHSEIFPEEHLLKPIDDFIYGLYKTYHPAFAEYFLLQLYQYFRPFLLTEIAEYINQYKDESSDLKKLNLFLLEKIIKPGYVISKEKLSSLIDFDISTLISSFYKNNHTTTCNHPLLIHFLNHSNTGANNNNEINIHDQKKTSTTYSFEPHTDLISTLNKNKSIKDCSLSLINQWIKSDLFISLQILAKNDGKKFPIGWVYLVCSPFSKSYPEDSFMNKDKEYNFILIDKIQSTEKKINDNFFYALLNHPLLNQFDHIFYNPHTSISNFKNMTKAFNSFIMGHYLKSSYMAEYLHKNPMKSKYLKNTHTFESFTSYKWFTLKTNTFSHIKSASNLRGDTLFFRKNILTI